MKTSCQRTMAPGLPLPGSPSGNVQSGMPWISLSEPTRAGVPTFQTTGTFSAAIAEIVATAS
jgi:hypothetical protein